MQQGEFAVLAAFHGQEGDGHLHRGGGDHLLIAEEDGNIKELDGFPIHAAVQGLLGPGQISVEIRVVVGDLPGFQHRAFRDAGGLIVGQGNFIGVALGVHDVSDYLIVRHPQDDLGAV